MPPPAHKPKREQTDLEWLESQKSVYIGRYPTRGVWFCEVGDPDRNVPEFEGTGRTFSDALLACRLAVMEGTPKGRKLAEGN